jgi:pyruvate/2-oxoglutarate dehydrogenase complex dihydrolipoamide dehydrogenase (E3) component
MISGSILGGAMTTTHYDCLVIGAGQAGVPLAPALAKAGRKTAIVEREHVGGTCINEGCTPTKTMVASARVAYLARRGSDYGVQMGSISVDMVKVRQRKRDIVNSWRDGGEKRLRETPGLDLLLGEASFTGPKAVQVKLNNGEIRDITADQIFINAGARPSVPSIPGLESVPYLNSTSVMELDAVPDHLLVLGGGYVGLEFAQMFRRFGSRVSVVQRGPRLLAREDGDVADEVAKILREDDIDILLNSEASRVDKAQDGNILLTVKTSDGERQLQGSHLLVAIGRTPNTERLNLDAAGVKVERGFIQTNDRLETNVPGIYALGDIRGGPAFTHISYDDFRIIRANLLEGGNRTVNDRLVPYTVFIDPQLGRVGIGEEDAKQRGLKVKVAKMPMDYVARASETAETRGFMKAIVDADTRQILGCTILGIEGGEIMSAVEIAMMGHLPYTALRDAVFAHPTLMESLNNLFTYIEE